jgi:hypothetical protein
MTNQPCSRRYLAFDLIHVITPGHHPEAAVAQRVRLS